MSQYRVAFGIPTYANYPGLWATLSSLRRQICRHNLQQTVQILVCDNKPNYAGEWIEKRVREKYHGKYIPMAAPTGTGPPRNRLFKESDAEWTFIMDDHVTFPEDDLFLRMIEWTFDNKSPDLYHGPCISDEYMRDGKLIPVWTHWKPEFGSDGLFGRAQISPEIMAKQEPSRILHSGAGFFGSRTDTFLGFHPEQVGFGAEGWLPLRYREEGRSVWCHPLWPWQHCFRPKSVKAPYDTSWITRGSNYAKYARDLRQNPFLTYSNVKAAHVRPDRLSEPAWAEILQKLNINEASMLEREQHAVLGPAGGPGTELTEILRTLGIVAPPGCDCKKNAEWMDSLGSEGCLRVFDEVIKKLKEGQKRWGWAAHLAAGALAMKTGLAFHISWLDPLPDIVREAIRRAAKNGF